MSSPVKSVRFSIPFIKLMAGIYIHIPFCKQACNYCNFHFATSTNLQNDFVGALLKEADIQKEYLLGAPVDTVYIGGGTPSLLQCSELESILQKIKAVFPVSETAEITLEANPDDIQPAKLKLWKTAGINRLSIGVQSFFDDDLRWMNRAHRATQAIRAISDAQLAGFDHITIDLIYGIPGLTDQKWQKNVEQALALEVPHLSCYALTVEQKTPLYKMISQAKVADVDPDDQARQFLMLIGWLTAAGYEHYEISNFAKPGKRSRHNSSYWKGEKYLGLGPSAHSYNGFERQWNVANNGLYIRALGAGTTLFEKEMLTAVQQLNEYLMISLRTMEGCDPEYLVSRFGEEVRRLIVQKSEVYILRKQMEWKNKKLALTSSGKLLADGISADLFMEEVML